MNGVPKSFFLPSSVVSPANMSNFPTSLRTERDSELKGFRRHGRRLEPLGRHDVLFRYTQVCRRNSFRKHAHFERSSHLGIDRLLEKVWWYFQVILVQGERVDEACSPESLTPPSTTREPPSILLAQESTWGLITSMINDATEEKNCIICEN